MIVVITNTRCTVTRETGDKKFYRGGWSDAESQLLNAVKKILIKKGFDVIKKRMWRDGHLVDDTQQYIRSRHVNRKGAFMIFNDSYAIYDAGERYNRDGEADFKVVYCED